MAQDKDTLYPPSGLLQYGLGISVPGTGGTSRKKADRGAYIPVGRQTARKQTRTVMVCAEKEVNRKWDRTDCGASLARWTGKDISRSQRDCHTWFVSQGPLRLAERSSRALLSDGGKRVLTP